MKIFARLFWLLTFVALFTGSASAQCVRHFYNNSSVTFRVIFVGTCGGGAVSCTVGPGRTMELFYPPLPIGSIGVSSSFYNQSFGLSGCYIMHSGGTGAIAVNAPADGDITTCGRNGWRCPSVPTKPGCLIVGGNCN
jgi:hypothetical protein